MVKHVPYLPPGISNSSFNEESRKRRVLEASVEALRSSLETQIAEVQNLRDYVLAQALRARIDLTSSNRDPIGPTYVTHSNGYAVATPIGRTLATVMGTGSTFVLQPNWQPNWSNDLPLVGSRVQCVKTNADWWINGGSILPAGSFGLALKKAGTYRFTLGVRYRSLVFTGPSNSALSAGPLSVGLNLGTVSVPDPFTTGLVSVTPPPGYQTGSAALGTLIRAAPRISSEGTPTDEIYCASTSCASCDGYDSYIFTIVKSADATLSDGNWTCSFVTWTAFGDVFGRSVGDDEFATMYHHSVQALHSEVEISHSPII